MLVTLTPLGTFIPPITHTHIHTNLPPLVHKAPFVRLSECVCLDSACMHMWMCILGPLHGVNGGHLVHSRTIVKFGRTPLPAEPRSHYHSISFIRAHFKLQKHPPPLRPILRVLTGFHLLLCKPGHNIHSSLL